ncbi:MAG: T9SS type A sorting domain-containing protein [Sphingobacteriales bacterium]|nr:MAG: T9SS type A sorting domain-containing protein [Sphingobacteriales bacterium]
MVKWTWIYKTKFSIAYYSSYTNPTGSNGDVYMQNNNISGGTFGTNEYEVNTNALAQPSSYSSENDIPLAVSNCSNNGDDLLTVWYGGWPGTLLGWGYINYKLAGNSYTFRPTGIENAIVNNFDVSAYPNPTNNSVVLKASSVNKSAKVTISNISGCIVKEIDIDQLETNINMSSLAPGVYQLRYKDDVNSKTIKVVKE